MKLITIGRSEENDVVVNDPCTSRHHMQIIQHDDGHYTLADFGSTNGTYVNGARVHGETPLNPTDVVRIGNTTVAWVQYFQQPHVEPHMPPSASYANPVPNPVAEQGGRRRNGFVTFWLILMIISGVFTTILAIVRTIKIIPYYNYKPALFFVQLFADIAPLLLLTGAILMLAWKKTGFWLYTSNAAINLISSIILIIIAGTSPAVIGGLIGSINGPIALWAILQIRKNGVSCWKLLE